MTRPSYQVVVSFLVVPHPRVDAGDIRHAVYDVLENDLASTEGVVSDLDVAVREIGAGGERSEDEGRYDHPSVQPHAYEYDGGEDGHCRRCGGWPNDPRHEVTARPNALANLDDVQHVRATDDVQAKDKRL